ncbi:MAG: DUF4440 domain-containing protein [Verrucomicrobia bacterium]|nr:DUF4440 domain-containing protein [Verrucomicrobiota bacterium]
MKARRSTQPQGQRLTVATAAVLVAAGCATTAPEPKAQRLSAQMALIEVDREFAQAAQELGVGEAFARFAAEDALLLPMSEAPVKGREAIRQHFPPESAVTLTWAPREAQAARSGDLGYTWGTYEVRGVGPDGRATVRHGKYVTIWRQEPGGAWKWVVDIGNPSPAP